jgi:DNA-binding PucR family transcriptional regulator
VVAGPVVPDLHAAQTSAREALAGHRAAAGWPQAPRPVAAVELLSERVLHGDSSARRHLLQRVHAPLSQKAALVETLSAYFDNGQSIEATARVLFVHPNTVRYRLRQISEITGLLPTDARDALTLRLALVLGRQAEG